MRKKEKFNPGFKVKGYKVILPPGKGKYPDILGQALRILAHIVKEKGIFYEKKSSSLIGFSYIFLSSRKIQERVFPG